MKKSGFRATLPATVQLKLHILLELVLLTLYRILGQHGSTRVLELCVGKGAISEVGEEKKGCSEIAREEGAPVLKYQFSSQYWAGHAF